MLEMVDCARPQHNFAPLYTSYLRVYEWRSVQYPIVLDTSTSLRALYTSYLRVYERRPARYPLHLMFMLLGLVFFPFLSGFFFWLVLHVLLFVFSRHFCVFFFSLCQCGLPAWVVALPS